MIKKTWLSILLWLTVVLIWHTELFNFFIHSYFHQIVWAIVIVIIFITLKDHISYIWKNKSILLPWLLVLLLFTLSTFIIALFTSNASLLIDFTSWELTNKLICFSWIEINNAVFIWILFLVTSLLMFLAQLPSNEEN